MKRDCKPKPISYDTVRRLFDYKNDQLIWKTNNNPDYIGKPAGSRTPNKRYQAVRVDGRHCKVHRVVFLWHHGFLPNLIDHIDGDPHNNRIENLREATNSINQRRKRSAKNSSSKYKGVALEPSNKWRVTIFVNEKIIYLGLHSDEEEAAKVYDDAAIKYYGEHARLNLTKEAK